MELIFKWKRQPIKQIMDQVAIRALYVYKLTIVKKNERALEWMEATFQ